MHLFPKRVMSAFQRTTDIFNQRGTEYGDTWKHCTWLKFRAVAKELGCVIPDDACRALVAAGLADLKYFRFGGGYKEDNFDDGINYDGFTVEEVRHVKVERQLDYRKAESAAQFVPSGCSGSPKTLENGDFFCEACRLEWTASYGIDYHNKFFGSVKAAPTGDEGRC
jgi:hypothetical protein